MAHSSLWLTKMISHRSDVPGQATDRPPPGVDGLLLVRVLLSGFFAHVLLEVRLERDLSKSGSSQLYRGSKPRDVGFRRPVCRLVRKFPGSRTFRSFVDEGSLLDILQL